MAIYHDFKIIRLVVCAVISLSAGVAFGQDTLTVEQLDYKFVTIENGQMLPVSSLSSTEVAGTFVPCIDQGLIEFCGSNVFSVWVDGRFVTENSLERSCVYLETKQLCRLTARDTVFVSLVSERGLEGVTTRSVEVAPKGNKMQVPSRRSSEVEFWKMGFIGCALILIVARLFIKKNFGYIPRPSETFTDKFFTASNLVQLVITCLLGSFIWTYASQAEPAHILFVFGSLIFWWVIKTSLTLISGALFRFRLLATWQSNFLLQFWTILFVLLFIMALLDNLFLNHSLFSLGNLTSVLSALQGAFMVALVLVFTFQKGTKSLHRFIYLCSTEILPGLLIIQFFLE
ncbi:MAG: hypothetical protein RIF46_00450 [Cyclobacteriaceae bacterium]